MRRFIVTVLILLLATAAVAADTAKVWVCPMADHTQEFDKPGTCPICGMTLVEKNARFRVAVLVFQYAEDIDFTAPIEVLGHTGAQIFTVAVSKDPITTVFGLHVTPDYDLDHAPAADLILMPGGGVDDTAKNPKAVAWLKDRATKTKYVMSVCNGAFILASAGLLDGLTATTTAGRIDELAENFPKVHVVRERYVDNGKIMTTAGLSAGIDGALHVIDRQWGRARAEQVARGIEYRWDPNSKWTRAQYADMHMPDIKLPDDANWEMFGSDGDNDHWTTTGRLRIAMTEEAALDMAAKQLTEKGWAVREAAKGKRSLAKKDRDGQTWLVTLTSRSDKEASTYLETLSVRKISG
ncbi:MAG TPA: DJ-1/PfpI family protein [Thermoanaerobaculia bacterium]|nr:DJ-1/PfpI family protein [Thermoanaerobaculia bacterium]